MNNHFLSNINHICFLTALTFLLLMLSSCHSKNNDVTAFVVIDRTDDAKRSSLLINGISLVNVLPDANNITVLTSVITDVSYNNSSITQFKSEFDGLDNPLMVAAKKKQFAKDLDSVFYAIESEQSSQNASQIYLPICKYLHQLMESSSPNKILIIESNLLENSHHISFIGQSEQIKKRPETFLEKLALECELPNDLTGVQVYLLWQPENKREDKDYLAASELFESLLESKGASVSIGANLSDKI